MASPQSTAPATKAPVKYLDTAAAYDLWSEVYDTDNNFLQALDTVQMQVLLPRLVAAMTLPAPWKLVDLGCGTGRNTLNLLSIPSVSRIAGYDLSPKMLEIARRRVADTSHTKAVEFEVYDALGSDAGVQAEGVRADAVISTLVLEHLPVDVFFGQASRMLKSSGLLLVTNMHSEMGGISQAGFVDPRTGEKIRPVASYAHTVAETVEAAEKFGLEVVGQVEERMVGEEDWEGYGLRAKKWVGVRVWYGGLFRKR